MIFTSDEFKWNDLKVQCYRVASYKLANLCRTQLLRVSLMFFNDDGLMF